MDISREDTLFNLRYAVRVLERHIRLWRRIDGAVRLVALLAGSGAIAALGAKDQGLAIFMGVVFAAFQALEFALRPADIAAQASAQRRLYAALNAKARTTSPDELFDGYQALIAEDDVIVTEALRKLAYNDVVRERGLDESACYKLEGDRLLRCMAFVA